MAEIIGVAAPLLSMTAPQDVRKDARRKRRTMGPPPVAAAIAVDRNGVLRTPMAIIDKRGPLVTPGLDPGAPPTDERQDTISPGGVRQIKFGLLQRTPLAR